MAEASGDPHDRALVQINSGVVGMCTSRWRRLAESSDRAASLWESECIGEQWYVALGRGWSALGYTWLGELGTARSVIEAGIAEAVRRGDQWAKANYWLGEATIALLAVGREDRVRELLADARLTLGPQDAGWVQSAYNVQSLSLVASEILLDLWEGDGSGAWHRISGEWAALRRSGYLLCRFIREWARFRLGGAALAAAVSDGPSAKVQRRTATRQAKILARDKGRMGEPLAELLRGALAFQRDRKDLAIAHLQRAERLFGALEMEGFAAASRERLRQLDVVGAGEVVDVWFEREGVVRRDRFAAAMAPGYD